MIKSHFYRGDILSMEQEILRKDVLVMFGPQIYKNLIKRLIFDDFNQIKIRLQDLSQHFQFWIYLVAFALKFFIHGEELNKIISSDQLTW